MKNRKGPAGIAAVLMALALTGFTTMSKTDAVAGMSEPQTDVKPFHALSISIDATVDITQASSQDLVIDASPADLEKIVAEVNNGTLQIRLKSPGDRINGDVAVHIRVPDLDEISVAGAARVNTKSAFKTGAMTLRISGSGMINFDNLSADAVEAKISGSGKLVLVGKAGNFDVSIAGSGEVEAFPFEVAMFDGKISGSGRCRVNVSKELGASIAGSGSISYKGSPKVNSTVAGSGSVRAAE